MITALINEEIRHFLRRIRLHNGFISVQEALEDRVFHSIPINLTQALTQSITTINGTVEQLNPQHNINNDTFISINDELKPRLIDQIRSASVVTQDEKCGLKHVLFGLNHNTLLYLIWI